MANLDRAILFKQIDRLYREGTFTAQSDGQLLDRYLGHRDEAAFEAIVNLHGPMVLSLCRRFLRDPRDIEDAFQATFLVLARKAESIRQREVLSSWLYGVAYRIAVRSRSEVMKRRSVETHVPLLDDPADLTSPDVDEIGPVLDQELNRLPEKYRAPIVLCYLKDQTHDQAAAELRWPVGTVRSRLSRGRELLKERLTRRGCTPATAMLGVVPGFSIRSFTASVPQPLVQATVAAAGRYLWGAGSGAGPAALAVSLTSSSLSGSATALAQGVLTTMALTQIKLITAGLTAGLLAGGLGMGAWALASPGSGQQGATPAPAPAQKRAQTEASKLYDALVTSKPAPEVPIATYGPGVEARLADLERKLDMLLERLNSNVPQPTLGNFSAAPPPQSRRVEAQPPPPRNSLQSPFELDTRPAAPPTVLPSPSSEFPPPPAARMPEEVRPPAPAAEVLGNPIEEARPPALAAEIPENAVAVANFSPQTRARRDPFEVPAPLRTSFREIEAQIQIARQHFERSKTLYASKAISQEEYEAPLDQIRLLVARLEGMDDDLADEFARLKVEIVKKQAQLKMAEAQRTKTANEVAYTKKLVEKKAVSVNEYAKYEAEDTASLARIEVQRSEFQDADLRIKQVEQRRQLIQTRVNEVLKTIPELAKESRPAPEVGDFPRPRR